MSNQVPSDAPRPTTESSREARSEASELSLDVIFDILSNQRRRLTLRYLLNEAETTTLGELAEHIAALENDKPEGALSSTERKRVYICLYQAHLPKMDDAGAINFDEDRKTVEAGENVEQFMEYLPEGEDTRSVGGARGWMTKLVDLVGL